MTAAKYKNIRQSTPSGKARKKLNEENEIAANTIIHKKLVHPRKKEQWKSEKPFAKEFIEQLPQISAIELMFAMDGGNNPQFH